MSDIMQTLLKHLSRFFFSLVISLNLSCTIKPDDLSRDTSITEIMRLAERASNRNSFDEAGDFYMEVDRLYPYSDKSREALVEAMKSYHKGTDLSNARLAATRYLQLYPRGPDADFAQYMIGLTFFDAIVDVRRDQGAALNAVRELKKFVSDYPRSSYSQLVDEKLRIAYSQLAGQEMSVGRYYMKREEYLAAISRFTVVITEYAETIFAEEAFYRLTEAYYALGMRDMALENNQFLSKNFPKSDLTDKSNKLVSKLKL